MINAVLIYIVSFFGNMTRHQPFFRLVPRKTSRMEWPDADEYDPSDYNNKTQVCLN